ncbi:ATP-binding protein [Lentzea sp. NPDC003310]|uniref:ATP-binding protein n=1 Tax=Lentzea sp. NPDC003310 TaxID=3154447 RepID=UPI0033A8CECD
MTDVRIATTELDGVVVATPVGTLDLASYASLRDGLLKQAASTPPALVVRLGPDFVAASRSMLSVFATVWMRISQWPDIPLVLVAETDLHKHELKRSGVSRHVVTTPDLASALARAAEPPPRRYRRVDLPNSLVAALLARDEVRNACEEWHLPALLDDALVVVSELVENAIRHGRTDSVLRIELRPTGLSIAVRDDNPVPPVLTASQPGVPGHRGLELVEKICVAWGTTPHSDGGKIVWAVLGLRRGR